jgi:F-type H+-transporting ATPase subunit epsilon
MATLQFDLVSPERRLASLEASEVRVPGSDGDMTAMADHAPTITTLRPGILSVTHAGGSDDYVVLGGFADISGGRDRSGRTCDAQVGRTDART